MELTFREIPCILLFVCFFWSLPHQPQARQQCHRRAAEVRRHLKLKGMIPSQTCSSKNKGVNPYCFFFSLDFHCLVLESHSKTRSRAGEPKSWTSGWQQQKRASEDQKLSETTEHGVYQKVTYQYVGLPSKPLIVDLILNSIPTALTFALGSRSLPDPRLDNGLHTYRTDPNGQQRLWRLSLYYKYSPQRLVRTCNQINHLLKKEKKIK